MRGAAVGGTLAAAAGASLTPFAALVCRCLQEVLPSDVRASRAGQRVQVQAVELVQLMDSQQLLTGREWVHSLLVLTTLYRQAARCWRGSCRAAVPTGQ